MQIQTAIRSGAVTKSDTTVLKFQRLYVGGTGDVAIKHGDTLDSVVVFKAVPVGTYIDATGNRVMATGTTATNIVWLDW